MAIFAISDLHLSFGTNKPMDVFGGSWENHAQRIRDNWLKLVGENDYVLLPGDTSWGIDLNEADPDFAFIEELPGKKIISKGNHDYWWNTIKKFSRHFEDKGYKTLSILHNNSYQAGNYAICGTRGWLSPDEDSFSSEDQKIFNRELDRLRLSLKDGRKKGTELIVMLHYPPFDSKHRPNQFSEVLKEFEVDICIYGHIHGKANESWKNEIIDGIRYHLVSSNIINFEPIKLG